jgi:hypothetical protein
MTEWMKAKARFKKNDEWELSTIARKDVLKKKVYAPKFPYNEYQEKKREEAGSMFKGTYPRLPMLKKSRRLATTPKSYMLENRSPFFLQMPLI